MNFFNQIYCKKGGNFELQLKKIQYVVRDTYEGEKFQMYYFFEIIVNKRNGKQQTFYAQIEAHKVKNPTWVSEKTNGLTTLCNTKELKNWFENMVQNCIEQDCVPEIIYPKCVWRKTNWGKVYVYSGGAIGAENCNIRAKEGYELMVDINAKGSREIFHRAWEMTEICKSNHASLLIYIFFHIALMTTLFEESGYPVNFLMGVIGATGSRKTSLCTTIAKLFNRKSLTVDAEFTSTTCGIEENLSKYGDALVLIDDYVAGETLQEQNEAKKKLQALVRYCGNRIPKRRMNYNIADEKKPFYPMKGCCLMTGEYITGITSTIGRIFLVNIEKMDVDNFKLSYYQNYYQILSTHTYDFLEWVSQRYDSIVNYIREVLPQYRNEKIFNYPRYAEMYATFCVTLDIILEYAYEKMFISEVEKNAMLIKSKQITISELKENEKNLFGQDIGTVLISSIWESINSGKLKMQLLSNCNCRDLNSGFQDEKYIYIQTKELGRLFKDYVNKYGLNVRIDNYSSIAKYLEAKDVLDIKINADGVKERVRKLPIQRGNHQRYLWIEKTRLERQYMNLNE